MNDALSPSLNWRTPLLRTQRALVQRLLRYHQQHDQLTTRLVLLAWIGSVGLPAYYLVWVSWFPQAYENVGLRAIGVLLCLPALCVRGWFKGRWLALYLFVGMTYVLPFFFTFMYLMNHASSVWSESLLVALIVLFHFQTLWAAFAYVLGTTLACLAFALVGDPAFLLSATVLQHLPIHFFAILLVSISKVGRRVLEQEKLAGMAEGLGSVSHELRTPLASIDANVRGMNRVLSQPQSAAPDDKAALHEALARVQFEVRHMHHMIDLFLLSASAVNRKLGPTERVSMGSMVDSALQRYPFSGPSQRNAVAVEVRSNFMFYGQSELCVVLLLNLLRNALKALRRAGKGRIRIIVDGARATPRLLFIDTGCGVPALRLPLIFNRFYSYPPNTGSGIGLALCKDIMDAWQARIRCVSREQAYAIFILEFPPGAGRPPKPAFRFPLSV